MDYRQIMAYKYISFLKQNRTHKQAESIYNQRIKIRLIYEKFSKFNYRNCPICNNDDYKERKRERHVKVERTRNFSIRYYW